MTVGFDKNRVKDEIVGWIQRWFEENGKGCNAVIGISGGKDSSIAAALCVEALGKDRVIGVMMPNISQSDIEYSFKICDFLGIQNYMLPVTLGVSDVINALMGAGIQPSEQTKINLPARIRMATLYAVSQSMNGRVVNTCNLSEDWVGYSTRYGDSAGDFCPLANLTVSEVKEIGRACGIPEELIEKTPSDGLCGKSDEENLGFTYDMLDKYIRTGECKDDDARNRIDEMHRKNIFKLNMPEAYCSYLPISYQAYSAILRKPNEDHIS